LFFHVGFGFDASAQNIIRIDGSWSYERLNAPSGDEQNYRQRNQIWPLWSIHDLSLDSRPSDWFPAYRYD